MTKDVDEYEDIDSEIESDSDPEIYSDSAIDSDFEADCDLETNSNSETDLAADSDSMGMELRFSLEGSIASSLAVEILVPAIAVLVKRAIEVAFLLGLGLFDRKSFTVIAFLLSLSVLILLFQDDG